MILLPACLDAWMDGWMIQHWRRATLALAQHLTMGARGYEYL
jgi:hypothetical protein